jgi:Prephenate dehydratase
MANIYVVGNEGSFTWLATNRRYGRGHKLIGGYTQPSLLVNLAIGKTSRITESAIVPIWNSNSGTIKFDQQKDEDTTAGTLKGDAGQIIDLWGHKISYALGVEGANLAQNGKIYSVAVAKDQCSDFFDRHHELNF